MHGPASIAKQQIEEVEKRCKLFGVRPGKMHVSHGDFRCDVEVPKLLATADVVVSSRFRLVR